MYINGWCHYKTVTRRNNETKCDSRASKFCSIKRSDTFYRSPSWVIEDEGRLRVWTQKGQDTNFRAPIPRFKALIAVQISTSYKVDFLRKSSHFFFQPDESSLSPSRKTTVVEHRRSLSLPVGDTTSSPGLRLCSSPFRSEAGCHKPQEASEFGKDRESADAQPCCFHHGTILDGNASVQSERLRLVGQISR
jgi:hypothetical protein